MTPEKELQLFQEIGEIRGALTGIQDLIQHSQAATNQRIDDLQKHVDKTMEVQNGRLVNLEKKDKQNLVNAIGGGSLSAAIIASGIELVKAISNVP